MIAESNVWDETPYHLMNQLIGLAIGATFSNSYISHSHSINRHNFRIEKVAIVSLKKFHRRNRQIYTEEIFILIRTKYIVISHWRNRHNPHWRNRPLLSLKKSSCTHWRTGILTLKAHTFILIRTKWIVINLFTLNKSSYPHWRNHRIYSHWRNRHIRT